jgi:hypothetical protein
MNSYRDLSNNEFTGNFPDQLVALAAAALAVWFCVIRKRPERGTEPSDVEANHSHSGHFGIWCLPLFSPGKGQCCRATSNKAERENCPAYP